jgi:hypothetical protein
MAFTSLILSKVIRYELNDALVDDCVVIITSLLTLDFDSEPFSVVQLSGLYRAFDRVRSEFESDLIKIGPEFKSDWCRDSKVFGLAKKTRKRQREKVAGFIHS